MRGAYNFFYYGGFDPGSGLTLAACLSHASRAGIPSGIPAADGGVTRDLPAPGRGITRGNPG